MSDLASCMMDDMVHLDKILIKRLNHIANESAQEAKAAAARVGGLSVRVAKCRVFSPRACVK